MIVKLSHFRIKSLKRFESSVNSYDSQTLCVTFAACSLFESSVNSYDSQTWLNACEPDDEFESSVNSYDSQTHIRHYA